MKFYKLLAMNEEVRKETDDARIENEKRASGSNNKRLTWALILLLVVTAIGGYLYINYCNNEPITLNVASGPYRSDSYELMREVADVVSRHSDTLILKVIPSKDSSNNISMLNRGAVDIATIRSDTPVASDVRMIADLFPDYFQLISRSDSLIYSPTDLIGKKIAVPSFGTDELRSFWIIGDHYDLPISGVEWFPMPFEKATKMLLSGDVDAVFTVRSLRDRILLNLFEDSELKNLPLRYVSLDQAEAIAIKRPFLQVGSVPKGTFSGKAPTPKSHTITTTVQRVLVTRDNLDPEPIRELTRILFENRLDLTIRFALASAIKTPNFMEGFAIPLHGGAQQYFERHEPSFVQENAEPLALMVTVLAMLISALIALRSRFVSTKKDRMDSYNYLLLDIAENAKKVSDVKEIKILKSELFNTLENVVRALDTDEVTEEGFQTFSFLWESVRVVLSEREVEINATH